MVVFLILHVHFYIVKDKSMNKFVYVIEPLRVEYGINLHDCVFKRIEIALIRKATAKRCKIVNDSR